MWSFQRQARREELIHIKGFHKSTDSKSCRGDRTHPIVASVFEAGFDTCQVLFGRFPKKEEKKTTGEPGRFFSGSESTGGYRQT